MTASVRVVGRYALYQAIASGGMATVFLGRLLGPVGFARTVAIKRLHPQFASDPEFVAMFLDEARLAARIRHPNVVPTVDVVATKGELFLVMEYVHGESVSKLVRLAIEHEQPIPVPSVVAILSGALQGLEAAHQATSERGAPLHIVHRDVSPQNILLGTDGQPRLLDFGVARAMGRTQTTQQGMIKGKIAYMPPEQLRGEELGPATDVYAAGVVLWEALVGRRLYAGDHAQLVLAVLAANAQPPSEALYDAGDHVRAQQVAPLDAVLMRALAPAKENRWQTAREFARALEAAVPPASAAQVSDWVQRVAGKTLRERATMVAEIESSSAIDMTAGEVGQAIADTEDSIGDRASKGFAARIGAKRKALEMPSPDSSRTITDMEKTFDERGQGTQFARQVAPVPAPRKPLAATLQSFGAASPPPPVNRAPLPPTLESMPAVSAQAPPSDFGFVNAPLPPTTNAPAVPPSPRDRHAVKVLAVGFGSGLVVFAIGGMLAIALQDAPVTQGATDPPSTASAVAAAPPSASSAPVAAAPVAPTPSASPSASAQPVPDPPPVAEVAAPPATSTATHDTKPRSRSSHSGASHAAANCNPPYTYDKDGVKHYKDECF